MGKVRHIVKIVKKCDIVYDVFVNLRDQSTTLLIDMRIRWNSTQRMIERFLVHRSVIKNISQKIHTIDFANLGEK